MVELKPERRIYETGIASSQAVLPARPGKWSYSALKDVETCPRRYVLSRADYPDLWDRPGFPRTPVIPAIQGDVVHGALEIIVRAMVQARCPSTRSPEAVVVLRKLGGYTEVAKQVLETQLSHLDEHPRIDDSQRQHIARVLSDWMPYAREQIQTYLNRMELAINVRRSYGSVPKASVVANGRGTAGLGDHPERVLVADNLRVMGRIDLLQVTPEGATITDFKTGAEEAAHHDQLRLYSLLWHADTAANPNALPVAALIASYPSHEVSVPVPDVDELNHLTSDIKARVTAADAAVLEDAPEAVVGEQCNQCSVRVLCNTYWEKAASKTADVDDNDWFDLQGTVIREHGVKSWLIRESRSGHEVLVRTQKPSVALPVGKTVRILGVRRRVDPDNEYDLVASLTSASETHQLRQ